MRKKIVALLFTVFLFAGNVGCSVTTTGKSNWELHCGLRIEQLGDKPASIEIKSSVVDHLMDDE